MKGSIRPIGSMPEHRSKGHSDPLIPDTGDLLLGRGEKPLP
jgi:hypothetical protein